MLISADIIKNKKVTGYYAWKQDIINAGAEFVDNPSVEDGNIITSPHYKYNGECDASSGWTWNIPPAVWSAVGGCFLCCCCCIILVYVMKQKKSPYTCHVRPVQAQEATRRHVLMSERAPERVHVTGTWHPNKGLNGMMEWNTTYR